MSKRANEQHVPMAAAHVIIKNKKNDTKHASQLQIKRSTARKQNLHGGKNTRASARKNNTLAHKPSVHVGSTIDRTRGAEEQSKKKQGKAKQNKAEQSITNSEWCLTALVVRHLGRAVRLLARARLHHARLLVEPHAARLHPCLSGGQMIAMFANK
jgi:hypothetical protein